MQGSSFWGSYIIRFASGRYSCTIMKPFVCLLTLLPAFSYARPCPDSTTRECRRTNIIGTLSVGAINNYRNDYTVPAGFERNSVTGFLPMIGKIEYGIGRHTGLAATFGYDAFMVNYYQLYQGHEGTIRRYKSNRVQILSAGVSMFYHILPYERIDRWDPFVGLGFSLNNITQHGYPQGDSSIFLTEHSVTPYLKAGVRYYITYNLGLFAEAGYDQRSVASFGASVRLGKPPRHIPRDSDGDGVPDKRDSCMDVAGLVALDGCPDTDGDGIADKYDRCPEVAGLAELNGCPDSDHDGIPDKDDKCPTLAGPPATHGCPDRDGDGVTDRDDKCPDVAGIAAFEGCPDTDGDGIPDGEDQCPEVAGPADRHGCPDTVKCQVTLKKDRIAFVTGKSMLSPASYKVLDEVVVQVKADPTIYLVVDGYADNTGKRSINKVISAKRAMVVKKYLVSKGISSTRIVASGHGSSDPVASNRTAAGRTKNRRATMRVEYR